MFQVDKVSVNRRNEKLFGIILLVLNVDIKTQQLKR